MASLVEANGAVAGDRTPDEHDNPQEEKAEETVHLGFVEPIEDMEHLQQIAFRSPDYNVWDGGQLGGCPSWLNPQHIPQGPFQCPNQHIMSLLCQIYAPVDKMVESAFHRSLYVFGCAQCASSNDKDNEVKKPFVRVLRSQLSQENPYFPHDPESLSKEELESWTAHLSTEQASDNLHLCQVCGFRAAYQCPLQKQHFCCKAHQKEYFKHIFHPQQQKQKQKQVTSSDDQSFTIIELPSLYPIAEIVVEPEAIDSRDNDGNDEALSKQETMFPQLTQGGDDESDSDEDLEQEDLNQMVQGDAAKKKKADSRADTTTMAFLDQCRSNPDQVLRYCRWKKSNDEAPLWFREPDQLTSYSSPNLPPCCEYCGGPRQFEFQLMPQMLHYLLKNESTHSTAKNDPELERQWKQVLDRMQDMETFIEQTPPEHVPPSLVDAKERATEQYQKAKLGSSTVTNGGAALDFGVVCVYTCTNSCGGDSADGSCINASLGSYREEYAWVQSSS